MSLDGRIDTPGLVDLNYIVANVLNELGSEYAHEEEKLLQLAIDGVGKLTMFHLNNLPKTAFLDVSDSGVAILPSDYIDYAFVAINDNGRLRTLTEDRDMVGHFEDEDGDIGNDDVVGISEYDPLLSILNNGTYYTHGGGYNDAYYKIDRMQGIISVGGTVPGSQLVLGYMSSGVSVNKTTLIPRSATEALKAWVHWRRIYRRRDYNINEKIDAKKQWRDEVKDLRRLEYSFNIGEYKDMLHSATYRGIKHA